MLEESKAMEFSMHRFETAKLIFNGFFPSSRQTVKSKSENARLFFPKNWSKKFNKDQLWHAKNLEQKHFSRASKTDAISYITLKLT